MPSPHMSAASQPRAWRWRPGQTLPRESRDTLFLLAVIGWIFVPLTSTLPLWCSAMAAFILVWRALLAWQGKPLPSRWWLIVLLLAATAATLFTYRTILGRDAGVTFIVVLLALKTLELRARRDTFVIFFLGFFTLLSHFFFSQSLLTAAAMLVGVWGLLSALVLSHMPVGRPSLLQCARTAGWMALLGAPIMALLFMLFPRIAPLWGLPSDALSGRSGLSADMRVGTITNLALDSSVAMRVAFDGDVPPRNDLYFRGPVLSYFDGREWRASRPGRAARPTPAVRLEVAGPPVSYQVTLEANNRPWVLVLDATPDKPDLPGHNLGQTRELQWISDRPMHELVRYSAQSYLQFRYGVRAEEAALQDYLDLPAGNNPRTLAYAQEIARQNPQAQAPELVAIALQRLRTGGYTYTLDPGLYGNDTADEFWFDRKTGFCEHIASAFVVLMRALGVPARIVTGYQGGERNAVDELWTVRQSDAHAWAEVWMVGQGWQRVDPTSAVAPGRTGSFARLQAPRGLLAQALGTVSPRFALNIRELWEAANTRWNQWVLNYSQSRQLDLLRNLGFETPSWEDLSYVLIALIVAAALSGAAWTQWERMRQDPWLRLLHAAVAKLRQAGLQLPAQAPPRTIVEALERSQVQTGSEAELAALKAWLLHMEAQRYSAATPTNMAALRREYRQLRWPRFRPAPQPSEKTSTHSLL